MSIPVCPENVLELRAVMARAARLWPLTLVIAAMFVMTVFSWYFSAPSFTASADLHIGQVFSDLAHLSSTPVENMDSLELKINAIIQNEFLLGDRCSAKSFNQDAPRLSVRCLDDVESDVIANVTRILEYVVKRHEPAYLLFLKSRDDAVQALQVALVHNEQRIKMIPRREMNDLISIMLTVKRQELEDQRAGLLQNIQVKSAEKSLMTPTRFHHDDIHVTTRSLSTIKIFVVVLSGALFGVLLTFSYSLGVALRDVVVRDNEPR